MSRIFACSDPEQRRLGLVTAAESVTSGSLVVLPTDTLYGVGCDAFNNEAVASLLAAKHRGPDMPVPVLVGSWDTIQGLVAQYSPIARKLVQAFWPGGLSIIVTQAPSLPWNLGDTRGTVMLRMPLHPVAIDLLQRTGPMAVSSANISGHPPATTVAEAKEQLQDSVSCYLDGGECPRSMPSTIVDISHHIPRVVRQGAVALTDVAKVLGVSETALI